MSHPEQLGFFEAIARCNTKFLNGARILEIGAYDVNGSMRSIFCNASRYVGVDLTEGPGVDVVSYGHDLREPDGSFDAAFSGECFEHDPHWRDTFSTMVRLTAEGGLVAFTCASQGRPEHGTRRTDAGDSPGTQAEGLDYYQNLGQGDFEALPLSTWFREWQFWYLESSFDLYFAGVRLGSSATAQIAAQLPPSNEVERLSALMPPAHRLLRLPLRILRPMVSERRYQALVRPYWSTLARAAELNVVNRFRRG